MYTLNDIIIRTVTVFIPSTQCQSEHIFREAVHAAASHANTVKTILVSHGISVQTIRLSVPGPAVFGSVSKALHAAEILDAADVDYASLGIVRPTDSKFLSAKFYEQVIHMTKSVSVCAGISTSSGISPLAIEAAASAVSIISRLDKNGFSNLRFAAVANVRPNGPFFPASYSDFCSEIDTDNNSTKMISFNTALGIQGATLFQKIITSNVDKSNIFDQLKTTIEQVASHLTTVCQPACQITIDFSTAPFPSLKDSVGAAISACAGVQQFPGPGSLMITSQIAASIDRARFRRTGFCGVMLPVSEDVVLARDAPALNTLLTCSAVCGTGLDTVPVAGDLSRHAIAAIMADVAALSMRLGKKQLTVRLMPIPGKKAGEQTTFDSPYMCNGPVLHVEHQLHSLFQKDVDNITIVPISSNITRS